MFIHRIFRNNNFLFLLFLLILGYHSASPLWFRSLAVSAIFTCVFLLLLLVFASILFGIQFSVDCCLVFAVCLFHCVNAIFGYIIFGRRRRRRHSSHIPLFLSSSCHVPRHLGALTRLAPTVLRGFRNVHIFCVSLRWFFPSESNTVSES